MLWLTFVANAQSVRADLLCVSAILTVVEKAKHPIFCSHAARQSAILEVYAPAVLGGLPRCSPSIVMDPFWESLQ